MAGVHGPSTPPPGSAPACGQPRTVCCTRRRRRPGRSRYSRPDAPGHARRPDRASNRTSPPADPARRTDDRRARNPASPGIGLALGQDRHGGVVAVQPLSGEDMCLDPPEEGCQHRTAATHLIGQGRQAEGYALPGVAFGLAVERLMLPVLLEQDHRQQAGAGPTPGNDMERRRSLADLLAIAAGELLTDVLDYLPLPRDYPQSLGDVLAQFAPPRATAAQANRRSRLDHPLARQMLGEGLARRTLADKATTLVVLATARSAAISSSVAVLSSSSSASSI